MSGCLILVPNFANCKEICRERMVAGEKLNRMEGGENPGLEMEKTPLTGAIDRPSLATKSLVREEIPLQPNPSRCEAIMDSAIKARWEMKKLIALFTVLMFLALIGSAAAVDQKGKISLGAYGGYAFGFGDVFKKYEFADYSIQNKVTFCFGAKVKYGITPNIALAGAVDYQAGKAEAEGSFMGFGISESESWHWIGILANAVYVMSPEAKTSPYFTAGGGFYIPSEEGADSKPGINAGVGVEHFLQENVALDAGARFHMIFTEDKSTTYVQGLVGITYYLGAK